MVNLKVMLLLFLLFFASAVSIALINVNIVPSHLNPTPLTAKFADVQPTGGEPIDDPTPV